MSAAAAQLLPQVADIARRAGREILAVYRSADFAVTTKSDASPVTAADLRAHRVIVEALAELTPQVPVLSEEAGHTPFAQRAQWQRYWLVDPLDGTREFLARNGQFTVNIALIEGHAPVLGVVHVPQRELTYEGLAGAGAGAGAGAWRAAAGAAAQPIHVSAKTHRPVRVAGSRSHRGNSLAPFLERLGEHELLAVGSALKFCLVAEGAADVYPRLGPTSEWDTAAAQAVLIGAGGSVSCLDGTALRYNTRDALLNPFFVAYGPKDRDWLALLR
jgi:3'(2'), 5'-bisphosphate nucleotidase